MAAAPWQQLHQQPQQPAEQDQLQASGSSTVVSDKWHLQEAACQAAEQELVSSCADAMQTQHGCSSDDGKASSSSSAPDDCSKGSSATKGSSTCGWGTCGSDSCDAGRGGVGSHPAPRLSWQHLAELLVACARGFQDPSLEALYLVFKNHNCSLLDATAGFLCTSMLLAATLRSLNFRSADTLWQLMTMVVYSLFFFLPYIIMRVRLPLFLQLREQLLVFGRNTGCIILALTALGYMPVVQVWKNVICNTWSLQIQNGFILPACQQVRLPAALMIAAVHVPADAIYLAIGRPFCDALLHSSLMQLCSVTVALVFDAWCRVRFLQRYSGLTAAGQLAELAHQQL
jgi:hypothetical protein